MRQKKKSVNGKGNVIMKQNRREGDNNKKNKNLTHFQQEEPYSGSGWEEVDVNAVTGQYRGRRKRRSCCCQI